MHRYVTDPDSLENAEGNVNTRSAERPNPPVEISKSFHLFSLDGKDDVAGLDARSFGGTS